MTPSANTHTLGRMARWERDAKGRLQLAALELFRERGYAEVTVAEIADRAGLTKRTFFNHFADKREVLFAGAKDFEASIVKHLTQARDDLAPQGACKVGGGRRRGVIVAGRGVAYGVALKQLDPWGNALVA